MTDTEKPTYGASLYVEDGGTVAAFLRRRRVVDPAHLPSVARLAEDGTPRLAEDGTPRMTEGYAPARVAVARLAEDGTARLTESGNPRYSEGV